MKRRLLLSPLLLINLVAFAQQIDSVPTKNTDTLKSNRLNEIVIKSILPVIQIKTGKTVLNVESITAAAGLSAIELLRQVPGVTIDGQDNIKISGKNGVQVMVDGRIQALNGQQIAAMLKGTSAANLKAIEVMSNPSSKYDAAGNAGIINLVFKKTTVNGLSGNVLAGYQQMRHYRQNSALNINLKEAKISAFINGNLDNSLQFTKVSSDRILSDKMLNQDGTERQGYSNSMLRSGVDVELNKSSKIGAIITYQRIWDDFPSNANTNVSGISPDMLSTTAVANLTENRLGTNLNYQITGTKDNKLVVEADGLRYTSSFVNSVDNRFANNGAGKRFEYNTATQINLVFFKVDYTQKLAIANFESGLKFSSSETANLLTGKQTANDLAELNQRNDFNYNEKIGAAYVNLDRTFGNFSLQIGIRGEYTNMKGVSEEDTKIQNAQPDTAYLNLFPTFFFRYQVSEKTSIGLAYSRRVGRPSFQDQNPYLYRTDFYYASRGNPLLLPQFTQSIELDYTFAGQRQIKINYSATSNLIEVIRTQQGDQTLEMPVNAGIRSFLNVTLSTPFKLFKAWTGYFYAEPYYQFYRADLSRYSGLSFINQGGAGFNGSLSNTIDLGNSWKAGLNTWFNYASRSSIYETKPIYSVDCTLKKTMFTDKLNISLALRDIFNTQKWTQTAVVGTINQRNIRKWESRGVYVGLNYNFGNKKIKSLGGEKVKTEEQERIKSRG